MKTKHFIILLLAVFFAGNVQVLAQYKSVKIDSFPKTVDGFIAMRNALATSPEGGAAMFIVALRVYQKNPALGKQFLVLAVDKSRLKSGDFYKGYSLYDSDMRLINEQLRRYPYILASYVKGATPQNNYTVGKDVVFEFKTNPYSGNAQTGPYKLFAKCSGAASPRPVIVKKNNHGIWKATNWNSLLSGIMPPQAQEDDDL